MTTAAAGAGELLAVCVVHALVPTERRDVEGSAIDKRPVSGAVAVGPLGLAGDTQCDTAHHGGVDQALYAYAEADADWWAEQLGSPVSAGLFGENLRLAGLDVTGAEIGERWQLGEGDDAVLVEVTAPRTPCATFATRMAPERHWVRRFTEAGRPGAYLRVLQPGAVAAGDPVRVLHRPGHGVTVGAVSARDAEALRTLAARAEAGELTLGRATAAVVARAVAAG